MNKFRDFFYYFLPMGKVQVSCFLLIKVSTHLKSLEDVNCQMSVENSAGAFYIKFLKHLD